MYTRALTIYKNTNNLPTYLAIRPWGTNPITDTTKNTITQQDITNTATEVKNYLEATKTLPEYINIQGILVNQATFLQLLTTTTQKINNTDNTPLTLTNTKQPTTNSESLTSGNLNKTGYLTLAQEITTYIQNHNNQAPGNITTSLGDMNFQSLIYMYCRVINKYKDNSNTLPTLTTVRPWSAANIPILDDFFTTQQITNTAIEVKNYIEATKTLPDLIKIGGLYINQSQFLHLITTATLQIDKNDNTLITLINANVPSSSYECVATGSLLYDEYITIANTTKNYVEANKKAPSYVTTSIGQMCYQSLIYMYCRIINQYNVNTALPAITTVKSWTSSNIPIYESSKTSFTVAEITSAAADVKNFVDTTGDLPVFITISGVLLNQTQFLHLITAATILINNSNSGSVGFISASLPITTINDALNSGTLNTSNYVLLAQNIKTFIEQNKKGPGSMTVSLGTVSFKSMVYMYCRVLQQYNLHKTLPAKIIVENWATQNIPIYDDVFTNQEIMKAAADVKAYFVGADALPELITISGVQVNQAQFLQLLVTATIKLNDNNNTVTYLQKGIVPSDTDLIVYGTLPLNNYIALAQNINSYFVNHNQNGPSSISCSLGTINFQKLVYTYSRILESYKTNNILPANILLYKPIYVTSDNVYDTATDWNRMAALVDLLRNAGADAHAFGIGPDTQNAVLRASYVQQGALVVDIYGGACAGTIYAMIGSYYQGIKANREVYSIWISPPAWDITNLPTKALNSGMNFLPRAHDDTFSTYLPDHGYNSAGVWTDGLTNPDQFLNNHGFNFMVSGGALTEMANNILNQAKD